MSKKSWLLLFFVLCAIGYFVASKLNPAVDPWIYQNILTPIGNGIKGTAAAITSSPTWQTWIAPNIGWMGLGLGFIGGLLTYRWAARKRLPWQKAGAPAFQPQSGPPPIASTYVPPPTPAPTPAPSTPAPTSTPSTPAPTQTTTQPTSTTEKKEEAAAVQ